MSKPCVILVVDDEPRNIKLLETLLRHEGYEVAAAGDGASALHSVQTLKPDLILLDAMMPGMDGFEVARTLKSAPDTRSIPIIMVTSLDDRSSRLLALKMGAEEFLTKPVDRAELYVRVRNLLRLKEHADLLASHASMLETRVSERSEQLAASYRQTIAALTRAAAFRDEETGAHVQRISVYCVEMAQTLGLDRAFCECIQYASPMHDIGKLAIPDRILLKPGPLDATEWETMRMHSTLGARMLEGGDSPYLKMGRDIALSHHERWDGSGYPAGLAGEAIPLAARLMCIADVYDALRSVRCYKTAIDHKTAVALIQRGGDGRINPAHFDPAHFDPAHFDPAHFDPEVLAAFNGCHARLEAIYHAIGDPVVAE